MNPGLPDPPGETPFWEEPVRGFYTDPGQFVTLSGLDLLRSMLEGGVGPPIRYLFGLELTSVEPGGVTFTMPRSQHGDRHIGGVRRGRQEGCRRDRISRNPAGPASHRDN